MFEGFDQEWDAGAQQTQMRKFAEENDKEIKEKPSLSTIAVEERMNIVKKINVLLDGGASHHVYYGPKVPEGALRREVELAHGTKTGYVKGSDITFVDEAISEEQAKVPAIISLGRLIQRGIKLEWTKNGASLVLPSKKRIGIPVRNNCPYANEEVLRIVEKLRKIENQQRNVRVYFANMYSALKLRIKTQAELDQHRREGHVQYSPDCPACKRGVAKQRPHYRAECKEGGELSIDIGGPYVVGIPITERALKAGTLYSKWLLAGAFYTF